ncbi:MULTISPECIES: DUF58 domain-containing protein [unclassified Vibrio]|uniref:DUF58 domain-containing protein n=1 Tax=Vibrio sp. HB236076 TaxID=3232307 RepID=A0AB39HGB6_9VIBR|nr:DUF58 domain-containing protein [Vibrio sp. HB161653]MDP5252642.1 DUF58 domain-containing protein [Vibrio sp. HB161653]
MAQTSLPPHANGVHLTLDELLYYRSQSVRWLPPQRSIWRQMAGNQTSKSPGRGMDFHEVRQYQVGDDIRTIDWRVTARTGKAHTKVFTEDREKPLLIYLDLQPTLFWGSNYVFKSVQLAHFTSVLSWLTLANRDRVGAVIHSPSQTLQLPPSSRQARVLSLLEQMCALHNQHVTAAFQSEQAFHPRPWQTIDRLAPHGADIVLLGDWSHWGKDDENGLHLLAHRHSLKMVQIADPMEQGQSRFRGQFWAKKGRRQQRINFGQRKQRQSFEHNFIHHQQRIKDLCQQREIAFLCLSSGQPLLAQLT